MTPENELKKRGENRKKYVFAVILSVVYTAVTLAACRNIFTFPNHADARFALAVTDYCICRVLAFAALFFVFLFAGTILFEKSSRSGELLEVLKCALVYLPVIAACLVIKLPAGFLTNDEYAIFADATGLVHDTWFNYMTVYYYIVSLMLIPFRYGPIIMKTIIEFFVVGYTVYRSRRFFGNRAGAFMYVLFLLYPVIAYTTSAHRLPVYFLVYLALFVTLFFDLYENRGVSAPKVMCMLIAGAVLTQWRTEGIYLLVILPILMFIVYPTLRHKKPAIILIASWIAIQYIISLPQNGTGDDLSGAANDRMKPFYAYTVTNMYRNGLDTEKNADDLSIIDRYIPLEAIEDINEFYGDINYEDVLILTKEEFGGVRQGSGYTEYYDFTEASKRLFVNNPDVFARTRWGAFCYAALPYHITFGGSRIGELVSFAISIVKSVSYNLFIPTVFTVLVCVVSLVGRKWFHFFVSAGLLAHWLIVFVLAPASYFKYYFPVYIMGYFYMITFLIRFFTTGRGKTLQRT